MRKTLLLSMAAAALMVACQQGPSESERRAAELVGKLTLEQKASLMLYGSAPVEEQGIPAYNWWNEALHGVARNGKATVFPQPIGIDHQLRIGELCGEHDILLIHQCAMFLGDIVQ